MTLREWLAYGQTEGFCSKVVCDLHDGPPFANDEQDRHIEGEDFCVLVVRIYESQSVNA